MVFLVETSLLLGPGPEVAATSVRALGDCACCRVAEKGLAAFRSPNSVFASSFFTDCCHVAGRPLIARQQEEDEERQRSQLVEKEDGGELAADSSRPASKEKQVNKTKEFQKALLACLDKHRASVSQVFYDEMKKIIDGGPDRKSPVWKVGPDGKPKRYGWRPQGSGTREEGVLACFTDFCMPCGSGKESLLFGFASAKVVVFRERVLVAARVACHVVLERVVESTS